jgi:hypothetical protein
MLGLTRRELETELRDGLRHRQRAKAVGNCYSPIPKATAPVLDPTCEGLGVKFPRATRRAPGMARSTITGAVNQ